jgi:hypothetical protein
VATVLTNSGQEWVSERMAGVQGAGTNNVATLDGHFVAWGTGAGTAATSDTTLSTEASEARAVGTVTVVGTGSSAKYQCTGTLTADGTKTITNAGNLTASSSGVLIVHGDFSGIPLVLNDSITFTITLDPS